MKKKSFWAGLLVIGLMLMAGTGMADSQLSGMTNRIKQLVRMTTTGSSESENLWQVDANAEKLSVGPSVIGKDASFMLMRSSAYLQEDKYSKEAHVFVELKNVSGHTLYPRRASMKACGAYGNTIKNEEYVYCKPAVVEDGESLYIWEWFYNVAVSDISYFEVEIETETRSYESYEKIDATGDVSDGKVYAYIENNTDKDIFGIGAVAVISDEKGVILDIDEQYIPNTVGIRPGSTMVLCGSANDYVYDRRLKDAPRVDVVATYVAD